MPGFCGGEPRRRPSPRDGGTHPRSTPLGTLAYSEHLLGLLPIAAPLQWLTGSPVVSYNVTFLLTFVLSGAAAYILGRELTGRRAAAWIAGLAYAFAPYRMSQIAHLQVLASFWMPLALAALHRCTRGIAGRAGSRPLPARR